MSHESTKYAAIDAEATRLFAGLSARPAGARAALVAFMQHTSGLVVVERCPECDGLLTVTERGESAWSVSCPCGRIRDTLRGL